MVRQGFLFAMLGRVHRPGGHAGGQARVREVESSRARAPTRDAVHALQTLPERIAPQHDAPKEQERHSPSGESRSGDPQSLRPRSLERPETAEDRARSAEPPARGPDSAHSRSGSARRRAMFNGGQNGVNGTRPPAPPFQYPMPPSDGRTSSAYPSMPSAVPTSGMDRQKMKEQARGRPLGLQADAFRPTSSPNGSRLAASHLPSHQLSLRRNPVRRPRRTNGPSPRQHRI